MPCSASSLWKGFFSCIEVSNTPIWQQYIPQLAKGYLEPISAYAKKLNPNLQMFGSPYFRIGKNYINEHQWKDFWVNVFALVPSFDFIALQDGAGGRNYTFQQLRPYLEATINASRETNRTVLCNNELWRHFENLDASCDSRRPAPTSQDIELLKDEYPLVNNMIMWEWHSYLSPYAICPWKNMSIANYNNYLNYVTGKDEQDDQSVVI